MALLNDSAEYLLNIIRAALPYVNSRTRNNMEVALKTGELAETFQSARQTPELQTCDLGEDTMDVEGLLVSIQNVCMGRDRDMINTALNFYKTRNLYRSYQEFRKESLNPELQAASVGGNGNTNNPNNTMFNFLMSQLTPEQKSTFDAMNMLMNSGNFNNFSNFSNFASMMAGTKPENKDAETT